MTQRKAITFLGTSPYQETEYEYQQQRCKKPYFAVALAEMFKPDVMLVVMTKEAREKHWQNLQPLLANQDIQIREIDIPTGKTEDDLWEIFTLMAKQIDHGDRLIFDITHSFRSQPLLVLLVAGFVRVIKTNVEVEKLIYGAFEAKKDNITPVFDLTPFVTLLDWTTATEMFLKTGYASPLTMLVKQETKRTVQPSAPVSDKTTGRPEPRVLLTGAFKEVSTQLETLAEALRCGRPLEVMEGAASLSTKLKKLQDQLDQVERSFATQPFVLLLEQIAQQFEPLALSKPLEKSQYPENLHRQQVLLRWYLDHEQPVQAITLARELMVSQRLLEEEVAANLLKYEHRERAEKYLNEEARQSSPGIIGKLWDRLGKLRNDVAHVGMREDRGKVKDILGKVREVCKELLQLLEKEPMRNTLICTVGTSLFEANLKNLKSNADRNPASVPTNWPALLEAYQTKNWITLVNELLKVDPSSRVCGAEINTVEEMRKQKWLSLENLYFLVSDTVEGEHTGQVLKSYFANRADLKLKDVDFTKIEKLQDTHPQKFKTHGLRNLVREIGKYLQRFGIERVAIDATGGYKAQIAIAVVVGQALNVPVYYKHERFSEIIEFPPMPIALDYDILAENADILSDFERNQTFSATELGEIDDRLRVFLSEVPIDNEVHFELNAIGLIYLTGFRLRYLPRVKLEEAANRTPPTFGKDHHCPSGFKEFVNKLWQENPWITTIHSIPYGEQKGIKGIGFRVNPQGEERQLVGAFKHDEVGAKFRIRLPEETNVKLALAATRLNQQYRP